MAIVFTSSPQNHIVACQPEILLKKPAAAFQMIFRRNQ
jgi:hypothetical protein